MDADLDRLVTLKAAKAIEELSAKLDAERSEKISDLARRGIFGGAQIKLAVEMALKRIEGVLKVRYIVFKEVYGQAGLLTPETLRDFGAKQVENVTAKQIEGHVASS